jgi:hypothetical protein
MVPVAVMFDVVMAFETYRFPVICKFDVGIAVEPIPTFGT